MDSLVDEITVSIINSCKYAIGEEAKNIYETSSHILKEIEILK